jgi:hypothetical protein
MRHRAVARSRDIGEYFFTFFLGKPVGMSTRNGPDTNPDAKVVDYRMVVDRRVVICKSATYRAAVFGGSFLLSGSTSVYRINNKTYANVELRWFGHTSRFGLCRITLLDDYKVDEHYNGPVVAALG